MSRRAKMRADVEAIIKACEIDPDCPFKGFELDEDCFSFNYYEDDALLKYFTFNLAEDYPDNTILSTCGQPGSHVPCDTKVYHQRLPVIFRDLAGVIYKKMNIGLPEKVQKLSDERKEASSDDIHDDDDDDDDDDEYDPGDGSDEGEETKINPKLAHDIENVKKLYGNDAATYRAFHSIDDVDVSLHIETMLDAETAAAWKVKRDEPIIIKLHMSLSLYLDGPAIQVDVFQPSQKGKFGIGTQLCKIIESFIKDNGTLAPQDDPNTTEDVASGDATTDKSPIEHKDSLRQLVSMGFAEKRAQNALSITGGELHEAVNLLILDTEFLEDSRSPPASHVQPEHLVTAVNGMSMGSRQSLKSLPQKVSSAKTRRNPKIVALHGAEAKAVPSRESGFLVQIMQYTNQRLLTLNEFCVVCDEHHVFQNAAMLKPAVCARDLCVFAFQTLGVMSDAAEDVASEPEVIELLVTMATAACRSHRRLDIFKPYPTVVSPQNPHELAFDPKKKDFNQVLQLLEAFMSIKQMIRLSRSQLIQEMNQHDILTYPLLQWIISSNRSHIVKLPPDKQLAFMGTCHQFLLLSSPPAQEAIFREERKKYGSTFAFHGSPLENWHSILRKGLINASGTNMQMNGCCYGSGIYLSPKAAISFGYSKIPSKSRRPPNRVPKGATKDRERFIQTKNPTCVALCEVVTSDDLKKFKTDIWVTKNPDHVCTRFFFIYEEGKAGDINIDTQATVCIDQIQQAVMYQFR